MQELSVNLLCVFTRQGIEIWIEKERAENFIAMLSRPNAPQFAEIDGNLVNRADITGIFTAKSMEEMKRRKNGEWQCKRGTWHERHGECACRDEVKEWTPEPSTAEPMDEEARVRGEAKLAEMRGKVGKSM